MRYRQIIRLAVKHGLAGRAFGSCSRPVGANCKHVVAALLHVMREEAQEQAVAEAAEEVADLPFALTA